jgi:hypothetical protein
MTTELQIKQDSPLAMAAEFLKADSNVDIDKLSKLLDVQERWEANEAKKAYVEAMAAFKANPPRIKKDKHVKYALKTGGVTDYHHATLENVTATINQALSKHGLTAAWKTEQTNGSVTVTCTITHIFGHSEQTSLTSAPDTSGSKNPIQAIGSTVSYLQRYTLLSLVGLATEGQDDDGRAAASPAAEPHKWTKKEIVFAENITARLNETEQGKGVKLAGVKRTLEDAYTSKGNAIPARDDVVDKWRDIILNRPGTLQSLKGN